MIRDCVRCAYFPFWIWHPRSPRVGVMLKRFWHSPGTASELETTVPLAADIFRPCGTQESSLLTAGASAASGSKARIAQSGHGLKKTSPLDATKVSRARDEGLSVVPP